VAGGEKYLVTKGNSALYSRERKTSEMKGERRFKNKVTELDNSEEENASPHSRRRGQRKENVISKKESFQIRITERTQAVHQQGRGDSVERRITGRLPAEKGPLIFNQRT